MILGSSLVLRTFDYELFAQTSLLSTPSITASSAGTPSTRLPSNSISHIEPGGINLWLGSGKGLARTPDGGRSFTSFRTDPHFARLGIFALAVRGDTIWTSTGYTQDVEGSSVQTGTGFTYTFDGGLTWQPAVPQPLDARADSLESYGINTIHFLPILVPEQNVTFDLALTDSAVWVASWSSGLRKSTDNGLHWKRIFLPPLEQEFCGSQRLALVVQCRSCRSKRG